MVHPNNSHPLQPPRAERREERTAGIVEENADF